MANPNIHVVQQQKHLGEGTHFFLSYASPSCLSTRRLETDCTVSIAPAINKAWIERSEVHTRKTSTQQRMSSLHTAVVAMHRLNG